MDRFMVFDPDLECTRNTIALIRPSWELIKRLMFPSLQKVLGWAESRIRMISSTAIDPLLQAELDLPEK